MIVILINLINIAAQLLVLLLIASVVLSYFMSPFHTVRQTIDRIINPMLMPIRQVVPLVGMFDLSPLILYFLIRAISWALINFLSALL
ncbi:MAG: YggT family protein [Anaerolineales bacterium]|uniref:YggT family protein n=1 Tax=Candidatus Desulfolinea nitratireducens TaxID=2841698 RepID=A0A8J6TFI3_9CHLR|nr:YggT family protein [Candidatus Desulfolinea nitratireducens]